MSVFQEKGSFSGHKSELQTVNCKLQTGIQAIPKRSEGILCLLLLLPVVVFADAFENAVYNGQDYAEQQRRPETANFKTIHKMISDHYNACIYNEQE
jgi:hypothetical protein